MKLQEIYDQLTQGEFSQLSIDGAPPGVIDGSNEAWVLSHINLGLRTLFSRFTLKQGSVVIALVQARTRYPLHSDYSIHSTKLPHFVHYLMDTPERPFRDDVLAIRHVLTDQVIKGDPTRRWELSLNDPDDEYSILTPDATTIVVPQSLIDQKWNLPAALKTDDLEVVYRASPAEIAVPHCGQFDPRQVEVVLPYSHLEPLLYFIASQISDAGGSANVVSAGSSYAERYEEACKELEKRNLKASPRDETRRSSGLKLMVPRPEQSQRVPIQQIGASKWN